MLSGQTARERKIERHPNGGDGQGRTSKSLRTTQKLRLLVKTLLTTGAAKERDGKIFGMCVCVCKRTRQKNRLPGIFAQLQSFAAASDASGSPCRSYSKSICGRDLTVWANSFV